MQSASDLRAGPVTTSATTSAGRTHVGTVVARAVSKGAAGAIPLPETPATGDGTTLEIATCPCLRAAQGATRVGPPQANVSKGGNAAGRLDGDLQNNAAHVHGIEGHATLNRRLEHNLRPRQTLVNGKACGINSLLRHIRTATMVTTSESVLRAPSKTKAGLRTTHSPAAAAGTTTRTSYNL